MLVNGLSTNEAIQHHESVSAPVLSAYVARTKHALAHFDAPIKELYKTAADPLQAGDPDSNTTKKRKSDPDTATPKKKERPSLDGQASPTRYLASFVQETASKVAIIGYNHFGG